MNKYVLVGAAAAGLVLGFVIYKKAGAVAEVAGDVAQAVNPFNNANVFNTGFENLFEGVTGTGIEDVLTPGSFDPTSGNNLVNRAFEQSWLYKSLNDGSLDPTSNNNYANRTFETIKGWFD